MLTLLTYETIANLTNSDKRYSMFGRQERLALLILMTVAVIVVISHLALVQIGKRPFSTPFSDQSKDGDLVFVTGTIDHPALTRTGGHLIFTVNNLTVFVPNDIASGLAIQKGTNVSIYGTVQTYQGQREVVVQSAGDILILS